MLIWSPKRSSEREKFGVNWAKALSEGEQVLSATVDAPGGLIVDREEMIGLVQTFRLSGGDVGTHVVVCRVITDGPQELEVEVKLTVTG